ncbi:hypothetical protein PR202_gb21557 [Eleusine coracana subsp. coracana]|uniref:Uncharacterized protein n=1 Tax=Eleusine coracana subsp. coracana TaxID=191504 RepID=A0AAV5FDQ4_ELECO|nr:hypothetical protein PR202_gb21557 [Eleusine coracana subsp. coracana]
MEEGGSAHTSLLVKDDTSSHGEDSQSLLEQHQGPQLKSRGPDWRAPVIILVLECLESMAFNGIGTNLVVYIRSVLHGGIASSASTVSLWYGTSFFVPILGATIADTYLGNYKTVLISLIMYLLHEPSGSPVKNIFQVIVASFRNMGLEVPEDGSLRMRLLDKAAIISDQSLANGSCQGSWRLCTVTQVEELKVLIRLLPIWVTGILFGAAISQMHTTFIQQGTVMNTKIGSLSIPPASLYSFEVICVTLWVLLVNKVIVPATRTCFANGAELTQLQRIGIGRFLMIFAMAIAAFLEMKRLESVQVGEPLSIVWQLPQYIVIAGAECFAVITQFEFFHGQAPDSMKSMLTAFALLTTALGNYSSSAIITLVAGVTRVWHNPGWIPDDLNQGHLDYYYWCLTALSLANFFIYIYFASKYKLKKVVIN